jgi:hypothetical protein
MIVLQQNHPRYQQIISPITFFVLVLLAAYMRVTLLKKVVFLMFPVLLFTSLVMLHKARQESISERDAIVELRRSVESIDSSAKMVAVDIYPHNPITYILAPREFLSVRTDLLSKDKIARAIEIFNPSYIVSSRDLGGQFMSMPITFLKAIPGQLYKDDLYLYRY